MPFVIVDPHTVKHKLQNMRTKTLLGLAVLAASAATVVAQNNVYSLNIVGYVNQAVPAGTPANPTFVMIGNPLKASPDNTIGSVLGTQVPSGASLLTWNGVTFDENGSFGGGAWDDATVDISPGKGFFLKNPGAAFNITFVGEVLAGLQTNVLANAGGGTGFNFVSPKVPVAGDLSLDAHLNLTNAVAGDSIMTWNGVTYDEDGYFGGGSWDFPPVVAVGQGFFYKAQGAAHSINWVTVGFP